MDGTYYGGDACCEEKSLSIPTNRETPILAKLKMQRERIVENLKTVDNAILMLEEHPEFAQFTDVMNKVGRI